MEKTMILTVQILDFSGMENDLRIAMLGSTSSWSFASTLQFWKLKSTCIISKIAFWTNFLFNYDNAIFGWYNLRNTKMRRFLIKIIIITQGAMENAFLDEYGLYSACFVLRSSKHAFGIWSLFLDVTACIQAKNGFFARFPGDYDDFY